MHALAYIKTFFLSAFSLLCVVGLFNFWMDSNWTFSHSHRFNNMQQPGNERIQKSNALYFRDAPYDALLLGSSRVTFFNQYDFKDAHVYNYAFSLAMPQEYAPFIEFAKSTLPKPIKTIYIGMDFYGSNKNFHNDVQTKEIFSSLARCCYRYKLLLSIDSVKTSLRSLKAAIQNAPGYRSYTRKNVTMSAQRSESSVQEDVENKPLKAYMGDIAHYAFNPAYHNILQTLKENNPQIKFVIFTTPTSKVYLQKLFDLGHKDAYKRWLHTLVDVFGEVHHFMDFNTVTNNYPHYYIDYHHLYPRFTKWIAMQLEGRTDSEIPKDFGTLLTHNNIDFYCDNL